MQKSIFFFLSVVLFVIVFYKQDPGLNVSIFGCIAWLFLYLSIDRKKRTKELAILSVSSFVSLISFAWYGDFISFAALFISLLFTGYKALYPKLNIVSFPVGIAFNYVSFIFRVLTPNKWLGIPITGGGFFKRLVSYFLIPAIFLTLFIGVYSLASDQFASFFTINWNLDIFQLAVLSCAGFFLLFNFFYFSVPKILIRYNDYLKDDFSEGYALHQNRGFRFLDLASQRRSGEISLILLNVLLAFFIITYCIEQWGSGDGSRNLSNEVHERVYILILSIVMAIFIIMIYFQGLLNFDKNAKLLKTLSFVWIGLNILLIGIVCLQNIAYVDAYGLTFKRIGVFIFLFLSLAGLLLTGYKMACRKTNIFLINRMTWVFYTVLVISCVINWSWLVTRYNTRHFNNPDWHYLESLNYNKITLNNLYRQKGMDNSRLEEQIKKNQSRKFLSKKLYFEWADSEIK